MNRRTFLNAAVCAAVATMPSAVWAASYATELSLSGGNVNFRLNEAADGVKIILDGGAGGTLTFGPQAAGTNSLSLGGATPTTYEVVVTKTSSAGFNTGADNVGNTLQTSDDGNPLNQYEFPQGLAVNSNPTTSTFGQIYISSARVGTTVTGRTTGDGIYALNSDSTDAYGYGTTAQAAGIDVTTGGTASPYKISVGEDGNVYIADWSDSRGTVWQMAPDLLSATQVLDGFGTPAEPPPGQNHGSIAGVIATGSIANGNLTLYVIDEDRGQDTTENALWRHDIGSGPLPYNGTAQTHLLTPSINFVSQVMDVARSPDGNLYVTNNRSVGNETGLWVANDEGNLRLSSLTTTRELSGDPAAVDIFNMSIGVSASPTRNYIAVGRGNGPTWVVPTLAGIPDVANRHLLPSHSSTTKDVDFDAAGNLYTISNVDEVMRVFSPGDFSFTVTGSAGTFTASPTWTADADGTIGDTTKWLAEIAPNGANHSATFNATTAARTIDVNAPTTLTRLILNNSNGYTFSGASTLTFDGFGPNIFADAGSHTISAPVHLAKSTGFSVKNASDTLIVSGALTTGADVGIVKGGAGTVELTNADLSNVNWVGAYGGTLKIGDVGTVAPVRVHSAVGSTLDTTSVKAKLMRVNGTVNVLPNGGAAGMVQLTHIESQRGVGISGLFVGASGLLNMNDNDLIVDYTLDVGLAPSPEFALRDLVKAVAQGGTSGIGFDPGDGNRVIAIAEGSESGLADLNGVTFDTTSVIGKYTYYGDANLDGQVTSDDYVAVDVGIGVGDSWVEGDFDFSGTVTSDDYVAIDVNLGSGAGNPLAFAELKAEMVALHTAMFGDSYVQRLAIAEAEGFAALVPEPGTLSLVGLAAAGLLGRRRRAR